MVKVSMLKGKRELDLPIAKKGSVGAWPIDKYDLISDDYQVGRG